MHNKYHQLKHNTKKYFVRNKQKCHNTGTKVPILVKQKHLKDKIALYFCVYKAKMGEFNLF